MDGSTIKIGKVHPWTSPRDPNHPHQLWLTAKRSDKLANYAAFRAANHQVDVRMCEKVILLHDSAQYHFIAMLLWERACGCCMSIEQAYEAAHKHHLQVVNQT